MTAKQIPWMRPYLHEHVLCLPFGLKSPIFKVHLLFNHVYGKRWLEISHNRNALTAAE